MMQRNIDEDQKESVEIAVQPEDSKLTPSSKSWNASDIVVPATDEGGAKVAALPRKSVSAVDEEEVDEEEADDVEDLDTSNNSNAVTAGLTDHNESKVDAKSAGKKRKKRAQRARKPKDMPKRPLSAYNIFFKAERINMMAVRSAQSNAEGGKVGFETLAKSIGKKWRSLSPEEMEHYKNQAEQDMVRYKQEMEDYHLNLAKRRRTLPSPSSKLDADDSIMPSESKSNATDSDAAMRLADWHACAAASARVAGGAAASHPNATTASLLQSLQAQQHSPVVSTALLHELQMLRTQEELLQRQVAQRGPPSSALSGSMGGMGLAGQSALGGAGIDPLLYERMLANQIRARSSLVNNPFDHLSQQPPTSRHNLSLLQSQLREEELLGQERLGLLRREAALADHNAQLDRLLILQHQRQLSQQASAQGVAESAHFRGLDDALVQARLRALGDTGLVQPNGAGSRPQDGDLSRFADPDERGEDS